VLKVSHNPIIWPDGIKEEPEDVDDSEGMKSWIASVKRWLDQSAREAESSDISSFDHVRSEPEHTTSDFDLVRCVSHKSDPVLMFTFCPEAAMRTCHGHQMPAV
jgi:hypothetical protein